MRLIYVIHDHQDRGIVEQAVIRPLPILGVDHWTSARHVDGDGPAATAVRGAMSRSEAILAVISKAAAASDQVRGEVAHALESKRPLIPIRIDATEPARIHAALGALPWVDLRDTATGSDLQQLRRDLADLLPASVDVAPGDDAQVETVAEDYRDREGFVAHFLGADAHVPLPVPARQDDVLTFKIDGVTHQELKYRHFSVVMSRSRRMCLFSAVNIDGRQSKKKKRAGWRFDPRIPRTAQIKEECYGDAPRFARGHMTRREDPVWGSDEEAATGNVDSMHVTNTVPQMQPFNAGIWLGLEDYALDHSREDSMRISVMTGPFFRADDPPLFGVRVPLRFWKVVAFIHDETGALCATGYALSQAAFISRSSEEFVFGQHETARHETTQISIASIEQATGLSFGPLAALDPFVEAEESIAPSLASFGQIRFVRRG
jgi:DNA/RNA endonuclease G (NUC1)